MLPTVMQSAVGSRQSAVGSRQSAVGSRQSAVGSRRGSTPEGGISFWFSARVVALLAAFLLSFGLTRPLQAQYSAIGDPGGMATVDVYLPGPFNIPDAVAYATAVDCSIPNCFRNPLI
jgi:hypothetical protein